MLDAFINSSIQIDIKYEAIKVDGAPAPFPVPWPIQSLRLDAIAQ